MQETTIQAAISASMASASDENVFLITGELSDYSHRSQMAVGYVIADSQGQAVQEQQRVQPNLRITGAVSLAELRRQVSRLEGARDGSMAALACGSFKERKSVE